MIRDTVLRRRATRMEHPHHHMEHHRHHRRMEHRPRTLESADPAAFGCSAALLSPEWDICIWD